MSEVLENIKTRRMQKPRISSQDSLQNKKREQVSLLLLLYTHKSKCKIF